MTADPSPELTHSVLDTLLRRFWSAREAQRPRTAELFPKGYGLTYRQLTDRTRVALNPQQAGGPLFHVAEWCGKSNLPPINALVVNGTTRYPGDGFFRAPGSVALSENLVEKMHIWTRCVEDVLACDDYPKQAP